MTAVATSNVVVQEPNMIEQVLMVIEEMDPAVIESSKQIEDINLRRDTLAKHMIEKAKDLGVMKTTKSPSTMRERVYDILATKTVNSRKIFLALSMKEDVIKGIKNVDKLIEATKWRIKLA